uniref:Uncharacterized protein n=1 Tax=Candidatus Kentrum sp. TC TaxID=2126339 RepID=A0A450Z6L4_9GAMM|nr:MAG: hypothetical protein BECKTC1821D_GA0114238_107710 [Candidatus Kentron sp. TC]
MRRSLCTKALTDGGIGLAVLLSDIHGKSAREMIKGVLREETPEQVLQYASKRPKATEKELLDAFRRIPCEAANAASRTYCALREKFRSLLVRRGRKRVIFVLAHKILKIAFVLISHGDS